MKKFLSALLVFLLTSGSVSAQEVSTAEILKRLKELEAKVKKLEEENKRLKKLLEERTTVVSRKRTKNIKVEGRVLFRFSQTENIKDSQGKSVYGDRSNGFSIRKARLKVRGRLNDETSFLVHIRADRGSQVELWDAYIKREFSSFPLSVKLGQFKVPLSMIYLKSGTKLWLPERPLAVNKIAPVWRDVGVEVEWKPAEKAKLIASVINGDGWTHDKIYNKERGYAYVLAVDAKPVSNEFFSWRLRIGYETGRDSSEKLSYANYGAVSVKRHLWDVETGLTLKELGISFEGGFLYDNPTDGRDDNGNPVNLGDAKGYYVQANYAFPFVRNLHLVGRYSWLDPNDSQDDNHDQEFATFGFYYLLNGWQAVLRSAYVIANERHGKEINNNLFVTELQLLF